METLRRRRIGIATSVLVSVSGVGCAHEWSRGWSNLLSNPSSFELSLTRLYFHWDAQANPIKIVGPLYFVGSQGLGSYLFVTTEGDILLNTEMPNSGPRLVESIRKLGFNPADIKILINGHAHLDHAGALAYMKALTGAQLAIMEPDVAAIEDGGRSDFFYGPDWKVMGFECAHVDRVLHDGDTVALGEVVLTAYLTPGHTRGSTTWVTNLTDSGKTYTVVFADGTNVNPGYRLINDPSYPGIADDYRRTFDRLETLRPDIWAAHHTEYFDFDKKRMRAETQGVDAWVDPEGFREFVANKRRDFEAQVRDENSVPSARRQSSASIANLSGASTQNATTAGGCADQHGQP